MSEPRWRQFEKAIQEVFAKNPKAKVIADAQVKGRSGRTRKLELFVEYPFEIAFAEGFVAEIPIKIAVDCKHHGKAVGIKKIEEFHGQMDDVGAAIGIMIAPKGFDEGAKSRAPQLNIYLINAPWDLMALAKGLGGTPEFYECSACADARAEREGFGGIVHWDYAETIHEVAWGDCDWCNAPHAMCPDCGDITGFCEGDLGEWIECSGACGRLYCVTEDLRDGERERETLSGIQRELLVLAHRKGRLALDRIAAVVSQSKWQYARSGANNPAVELDLDGWATLTDDGLAVTDTGAEFVEEQLPNARDSYYMW